MQSKDMKSLLDFWHWADNEKPADELFMSKAGTQGPMTPEAEEALEYAVNTLSMRVDCHIDGLPQEYRDVLKPLSIAVLQAWESIPESMKHKALVQADFKTLELATAAQALSTKPARPIVEPIRADGRVSGYCPSHGMYTASNYAGCPQCAPPSVQRTYELERTLGGPECEPLHPGEDNGAHDQPEWYHDNRQRAAIERSLRQMIPLEYRSSMTVAIDHAHGRASLFSIGRHAARFDLLGDARKITQLQIEHACVKVGIEIEDKSF